MPKLPLTAVAEASLHQAAIPSFFPADMVVSYDARGNPVSRYGDVSWSLKNMSTDGTSAQTLHFFNAVSSDLHRRIREQHKALMWLHMSAGAERSWLTLNNTNLALRRLCGRAAEKGVDLFTLMADLEMLSECLPSLNPTYLSLLRSALQTLWRHRQELRAPATLQLQALRACVGEEYAKRPEYNQTPLIPSRVYCAILVGLDEQMSAIEKELDELLDAFDQSEASSQTMLSHLNPGQVSRYRSKALEEVTERMVRIGYRPMGGQTLGDFIAARLGMHQVTLMATVVAYTGMRNGEARILPLEDVLGEFEHLGSTHYEVKGATHKLFNGIKTSAVWVTSHQGVRAIRLAQQIATVVGRQRREDSKEGQRALLFPSLANPFKMIEDGVFSNSLAKVRQAICPIIEQSDVDELDRLELSRNWGRDDILVGQRWPLAFHQLRRSLAVYAHRSGMVSLPALKAQLQHITEEMTLYYSDGFCRAVNLVFDNDHVSREWSAAKAESSYFAFVFEILFPDDVILGQGAERLTQTVASRSRTETLKLFKDNKVAYRETPLGGCVSTEVCKVDPFEPIPYDCLESNCVNLVVFEKRLDHVIKSNQGTVALLERTEPGSMEHRLEARHLEVLLRARERLKNGDR